jgi:hypothetical protein
VKIALSLMLIFLFSSCSCSSEKPNLDQMQLLEMVREIESDVELMVPPSLDKPLVNCYKFLPPCKLGYKVKIKGLEVTALYYEDKSKAKESATSIRGYQFRNWAFDQVRGEPILERFFENKIEAKRRF